MENQSPTPQSEGNAESGGKAGQHSDKGGYSVDAEDLISKLLAVGLTDDDDFPTSVRMERIPREIFEPGKKKKTRALVCEHSSRDLNETSPNSTHSPWLSIAENIQHYLRTSFQNVMNKMQFQSSGEIKPSFVARIGKVFFHGPTVSKNAVLKKVLGIKNNATGNVRKTFYTNVPVEYMQAVEDLVVPRTEFGNAAEKEHYHVKVLDQHGVTLSCKCSATKDGGKLEIHKVESITKRHFVADTLCLYKDFDLRLMLFTRETFGQLPDDMDLPIKELIESANIDPTVKGGLSWPPGKECIGDRFSVGAVWHDKYKVFKGPTMTLKLRDADRNDFTNSKKGGVVKEVVVKMTEITKQLKDGKVPGNEAVNRMFEEQVKLVWEKLLINHDRLSP